MKKTIILAISLLSTVFAYADDSKSVSIGMTEAELLKIKGEPFSSVRGVKKTLLQWPDFNAWTEDGKVISFYEKKPEIAAPIGQSEIEIMEQLVSLHNKIDATDGISNADYLSSTKEVIDFFKSRQKGINNQQFGEVCVKYLEAIQLFRAMLSLQWEKTSTKESFYFVRKDRNPEIYKLIREIPPEYRRNTIKPDAYEDAFEVYESGLVYSYIEGRYWQRLGRIFTDNLDKTKLPPEVAKKYNFPERK